MNSIVIIFMYTGSILILLASITIGIFFNKNKIDNVIEQIEIKDTDE